MKLYFGVCTFHKSLRTDSLLLYQGSGFYLMPGFRALSQGVDGNDLRERPCRAVHYDTYEAAQRGQRALINFQVCAIVHTHKSTVPYRTVARIF
jgi:hypothetical protein